MYTRSYHSSERPFRIPARYSGNTFSEAKEMSAPSPLSPGNAFLQPLAGLFGSPPVAGTPAFDELLLMGLIFLLLGSEDGKDLVPILALLLFCNP